MNQKKETKKIQDSILKKLIINNSLVLITNDDVYSYDEEDLDLVEKLINEGKTFAEINDLIPSFHYDDNNTNYLVRWDDLEDISYIISESYAVYLDEIDLDSSFRPVALTDQELNYLYELDSDGKLFNNICNECKNKDNNNLKRKHAYFDLKQTCKICKKNKMFFDFY